MLKRGLHVHNSPNYWQKTGVKGEHADWLLGPALDMAIHLQYVEG